MVKGGEGKGGGMIDPTSGEVFAFIVVCALLSAGLSALLRAFWNRVIVKATTGAKPISHGQAFAMCVALGVVFSLVAIL